MFLNSNTVDANKRKRKLEVTNLEEIQITKSLKDRRDELSPRFTALPYLYENGIHDQAYCMPVGSGTMSALISYGKDYNIKLGKTSFLSIDGPGHEYQWVNKVHSPGLVTLSFGIDREAIKSFEQKLDINRGSVITEIRVSDGVIRTEAYGVMNQDAIIVEVTDSRPQRSVSANYKIWRPVNEDEINPIAIRAKESRIVVNELHKYYKVNSKGIDKRLLPKTQKEIKSDNPFYHLGISTNIAFADNAGLLEASGEVSNNGAKGGTAKLYQKKTPEKYYLIITCTTEYNGMEEKEASALLEKLEKKDKEILLREHLDYWEKFWEDSYIDLYGTATERPLRAWFVGLYNYAIMTNPENPVNFNGQGMIVFEDEMQWGCNRYWQNNREILWMLGAAGKFDFFKDYLKMYDEFFNAARKMAKQMGKLGVRLYEAPKGLKIGYNPGFKRTSSFNIDKLNKAVEDLSYEYSETLGASARQFNQAAELTQQMFDFVEFSGDTEFMKETAIPWLKEGALFYLSLLRKGDDGFYHIMRADALETYKMVMDPTPDTAGIKYMFSMIIMHGREFGYEEEFIKAVKERFENLAPQSRGYWKNHGNYVEIIKQSGNEDSFAPAGGFNPVPGIDVNRAFNGENPELYLIYPFALYDAHSSKDEYERALRTFDRRTFKLSYAWDQSPIQAARLHLDETYSLIEQHNVKFQLYPYGGWESCCSQLAHTAIRKISVTPFFDAMGLANASLQEMLIQSHHINGQCVKCNLQGGSGEIEVIPAVNPYLAGRFKLHCRGGFIAEVEFQTMKRVKQLRITSTRGGLLKVANPYISCDVHKNDKFVKHIEGKRSIEIETESGDVISYIRKF